MCWQGIRNRQIDLAETVGVGDYFDPNDLPALDREAEHSGQDEPPLPIHQLGQTPRELIVERRNAGQQFQQHVAQRPEPSPDRGQAREPVGQYYNLPSNRTADQAVRIQLLFIGQAAIEREPSKPIVVRLVSVSFVDAEAKKLLTRMRRKKVKLIPTGCLMHRIVEQIEAEMRQRASRV